MTHRDRPPTSPPEDADQLLAGYVLSDLDAQEAELLAELLAADPSLLAEIEALENTLEQVYEVTEVSPPPGLRQRVIGAIAPPAEPAALPAPRSIAWGRWLAAGAIVALAISTLTLWQTSRRLAAQIATVDETVDEAAAALSYRLVSTGNDAPATATVTVDPNTLEAELQAEELPELAPDQVYVLWTILKPDAPFTTDARGAILTTTFAVEADGGVRQTLRVPPVYQSDWVAGLGVTVEAAAAPQRHAAAPVLVSESLL